MVMSLIESLTKIKNAVYGREVREAIHDGVFRANQIADGADAKADNTQIRQDAVEDNFSALQRANTEEAYWGAEIVSASDGEATLGDRLDRDLTLTTSTLGQMGTVITSYVNDPNTVTDWIPYINQAIIDLYNKGGGNLIFPPREYIVQPSGIYHNIKLHPNVSLIGVGEAVLKISDNNPDFYFLMVGATYDGPALVTSNVEISGFRFDSNIENNTKQIGFDNGRGFVNIEVSQSIAIRHNTFLHNSQNCIYMNGSGRPRTDVIVESNLFIFDSVSADYYDNTTVYLCSLNHRVRDNTFLTKSVHVRTAVESHVYCGQITDNYVNNYFTGVILQSQDEADEQFREEINNTPKLVSNNVFDGVNNGIVFWESKGKTFKNVLISNNIIKILNITRPVSGSHVTDAYGISLSGDILANHFIENLVITGNIIEFEFDEEYIKQGYHLNPISYDNSYGIGAFVRGDSHNFGAKNVTIEQNQIINSPMQPFSFIDHRRSDDAFVNISIKNNLVENPITYIRTKSGRRAALVVSGGSKNLSFEHNIITEPKQKNTLLAEAVFEGFTYKTTNGRIGNNTINDASGNVALYKDFPFHMKRALAIEEGRFKSTDDWSADNGRTYRAGDLVMSTTKNASGKSLLYVTEGGTRNTKSAVGVYEGDKITFASDSDLKLFKGGEVVLFGQPSDAHFGYSAVVVGVDMYTNTLMLSGAKLNAVTTTVTHKKPIVVWLA